MFGYSKLQYSYECGRKQRALEDSCLPEGDTCVVCMYRTRVSLGNVNRSRVCGEETNSCPGENQNIMTFPGGRVVLEAVKDR